MVMSAPVSEDRRHTLLQHNSTWEKPDWVLQLSRWCLILVWPWKSNRFRLTLSLWARIANNQISEFQSISELLLPGDVDTSNTSTKDPHTATRIGRRAIASLRRWKLLTSKGLVLNSGAFSWKASLLRFLMVKAPRIGWHPLHSNHCLQPCKVAKIQAWSNLTGLHTDGMSASGTRLAMIGFDRLVLHPRIGFWSESPF